MSRVMHCLPGRPLGVCAGAALAALAQLQPAGAQSVTLEGVTFAAASDNVRITGGSGSGTIEDPFVIAEEVLDAGEVILAVDVHSAAFGSRVKTFHYVGFALTKVVTNRTKSTWTFFNVELERQVGLSSDYYDGLSFAQEARANRPFASDRFATVEDILEPRDVIRFSEGSLPPGATARFRVAITHTSPAPKFFVVQHAREATVRRELRSRVAATTTGHQP